MRVPRPSFRLWHVMIAVAAVAIVAMAVKRASYCMDRAAWHARREANRRADIDWMLGTSLVISSNLAEDRANEHAQLRMMYERAAWRPWEPMPVDRFVGEPEVDYSFETKNQSRTQRGRDGAFGGFIY